MRLSSKSHNLKLGARTNYTIIETLPFTDADIVHIYDMLLTPGMHFWQMPNLQAGRAILWSFLNSLDYYSDIACLTAQNDELPLHVLSLMEYWSVMGYLSSDDCHDFSSFFANECTHDFLWIELDSQLKNANWFMHFENELQAWHQNDRMTILYLTCD